MAGFYGIDVSHYQSNIDWNKVKAADRSFAIIKATEGTTWTDPKFMTNWHNAGVAGLTVGAYHYFRPGLDPIEQAQHFYDVVGDLRDGDLIPWLDVEDERSGVNGPIVAYPTVVAQLHQCLDRCFALFGVTPGIYTGRWFWDRLPIVGWEFDVPLWVAHWFVDQKPGGSFPLPKGWTKYTIHQYTSKGRVEGIGGNVDLDWSPDLSPILVSNSEHKVERALEALHAAKQQIEQAEELLKGM